MVHLSLQVKCITNFYDYQPISDVLIDVVPSSMLCFLFLFFFRITTLLQYIEDSEPVVDGSRNRWCAVQ